MSNLILPSSMTRGADRQAVVNTAATLGYLFFDMLKESQQMGWEHMGRVDGAGKVIAFTVQQLLPNDDSAVEDVFNLISQGDTQ
jgi:hypothetical protein